MTRRFHAPWCGHCKELKPPFQEIAWEFSLSEKVLIATMDCSKYGGLCKQNNVSAYPTLRYWIQGKVPEERDFKYPVHEGVYTDWHGASKTAAGLSKLKKFVLERLSDGEAPPDARRILGAAFALVSAETEATCGNMLFDTPLCSSLTTTGLSEIPPQRVR